MKAPATLLISLSLAFGVTAAPAVVRVETVNALAPLALDGAEPRGGLAEGTGGAAVLTSPANLFVSRLTSGVRVTWSGAEGALSYTVKRGVTPGTAVPIATGLGSTALSYLDAGANPNTAYYYVVSAVGEGGATADSSEVVSPMVTVAVPSDFDGDGLMDLAVYRPVNGTWYILKSSTNFTTHDEIQFGLATDVPVPGDYDGDGAVDPAVYRPVSREWFIRRSNGSYTVVTIGALGDIPVPGDYDGDGRTDLGVYHPASGLWTILQSTTAYAPASAVSRVFGGPLHIPAPGDFDADGKTDLAVYNRSSGLWTVLYAREAFDPLDTESWTMEPAGVPAPGDYDGDGKADPAVRGVIDGATHWQILRSATHVTTVYYFGLIDDLMAQADFNGDGRTEFMAFRPKIGLWYGSFAAYYWGLFGDRPAVTAAAINAAAVVHARSDLGRATDFDGDSFPDLAVYRPGTGQWFALESGPAFRSGRAWSWGLPGDRTVAGDYDGDGRTDPAVYRPVNNTWYVLLSGAGYTTSLEVQWGLNGDVPVAGDYDGDGKTDMAVFRPVEGAWYIRRSTGGTVKSFLAGGGDIPVPADYDGDGKTDLAVYRQGSWYIVPSSGLSGSVPFTAVGAAGDIPVPGDYDGNGRADKAVYRPSDGRWLLDTFAAVSLKDVHWGQPGDIPVPGDYDGDRLFDAAVYRPSTGEWLILTSSSRFTASAVLAWGLLGDTPVPAPR